VLPDQVVDSPVLVVFLVLDLVAEYSDLISVHHIELITN